MGQQPSRPRPAKRRTLPPDAKTLEQIVLLTHEQVLDRITHLKQELHDGLSRRGLQTVYTQRSAAWQKLLELNPGRALSLAAELHLRHGSGLQIPVLEVSHEVVANKPSSN